MRIDRDPSRYPRGYSVSPRVKCSSPDPTVRDADLINFAINTVNSRVMIVHRMGQYLNLSGWPSGLRRQTQGYNTFPVHIGTGVLVSKWRRGFKSHS